MNIGEFLSQESGIRTHLDHHNGVWWRRSSLGCYHPLYPLQAIEPGSARPHRARSFLRYTHLTPTGARANSEASFMILQESRLRAFSLGGLPHEKRKAVNKAGRAGLRVERVASLEDRWSALQRIFVSTAQRTTYGLPSEYYIENEEEWRNGLRREFSLPGRDWFGVFSGAEMVGFLYAYLVDDYAQLLVTKVNAEYLEARPSDLLHFEALSYYRDQRDCRAVCAGRRNHMTPSIDRFKAQFGFEATAYPVFQWTNGVAKAFLGAVLAGAAMALRGQAAGSRRNLRYRVSVMRSSLESW